MLSLHERLAAIDLRLQSITKVPTDPDSSVVVDDVQTDSTQVKYICMECAWTTSTNSGALADHFTLKHTSRLKCTDCKRLCEHPEELKKHHSQKHRRLASIHLNTENQPEHNHPAERAERIATNIKIDTSAPRTFDQAINTAAPASAQSILNRKSSVQSGCCPHPGCQLTFIDFGTLYEHYIVSHPACITYPGRPRPFKCPFCPKAYRIDRFIPGHVRTHKPKSRSVPGIGDAEDQETLIRQSHVAMAHRRSQSHIEAQAYIDHTSSDEEAECSVSLLEESTHSLFFKNDVVYIDEEIQLESPTSVRSNKKTVQKSLHFREATPIGIVLQACPADSPKSSTENERSSVGVTQHIQTLEPNSSDSMDLVDSYPESLALDESDLRSRPHTPDPSILLNNHLSTRLFHETLSRQLILALQLQHFISVSEVFDLFTYFLNSYQRIYVLQEISRINPNSQDDDDDNHSSILSALHSTGFSDLITAWIDFKRLAIRYAPQHLLLSLRSQASENHNQGSGLPSLASAVTHALLNYCLHLEHLIHARTSSETTTPITTTDQSQSQYHHDFPLYSPLLVPTIATPTSIPPLPLTYLIAALSSRIQSSILATDPSSHITFFTNEMILRGTKNYITVLQMRVRGLYPSAREKGDQDLLMRHTGRIV